MSPDHEHRRALEGLYVEHERGLYNVAYRYVWSADDARDVVHDAFVRMWRKREAIDWPRAAGLAYRTVLGLAKNRRRTAAFRRAVTGWMDSEPAPASDEILHAAQRDTAVRRGIDRLPERLRSVLVMCTFSGLEHAAIGEILGVPEGTIGSRRSAAIVKLREELEHE